MGFNPPVPQRDSDWEIRAAVLLSLFLQVLLIVVGPSRKRTGNPLPRFASWSCYLLADWVADLALGLLVNNLGNIGGNGPTSSVGDLTTKRGGGSGTTASSSGGNPGIFAFWTPFLLLHLGGPDTITAYSIEDNELWLRHLIGLLFQLLSASFVFSCSLQGNPMIPATVLMFVAGIIKYGERTYSLYSGSADGVLGKILPAPNPGPNYAKLMTVFSSKSRAGLDVEVVSANGVARDSRKARDEAEVNRQARSTNKTLELEAFDLFKVFRSVCYDINLGHRERKISQAFFLDRADMEEARRAFELIEVELNFMYEMVHTKEPVAHTLAGCVLRFVSSACIVYSTVAFFRLGKASIKQVDIDITYALLLGALALDVAAVVMLIFSSNWTLVILDKYPRSYRLLKGLARLIRFVRPKLRRWSERTSQMNLIGYSLGETVAGPSPRVLRALGKVAHRPGAREVFDDLFFVRREPLRSSHGGKNKESILLEFIFKELKGAAQHVRKSTDVESTYEDVEEMRKTKPMEMPITRKSTETIEWDLLMDSVIKRDFDESLLMWHIATDLCFLEDYTTNKWKSISTTLSEYMLYLLVKQPKILAASAGVGQMAYQDTCAEARQVFEAAATWDPDHEGARRMLLRTSTSVRPELVKGGRSKSVLFHASIIAKELRKIRQDVMWEMVARVWMEMLTYAAGKCKGTTHLHHLARGGELITMVWLLMAHMGTGNIYQKKVAEDDPTPKLIIRLCLFPSLIQFLVNFYVLYSSLRLRIDVVFQQL